MLRSRLTKWQKKKTKKGDWKGSQQVIEGFKRSLSSMVNIQYVHIDEYGTSKQVLFCCLLWSSIWLPFFFFHTQCSKCTPAVAEYCYSAKKQTKFEYYGTKKKNGEFVCSFKNWNEVCSSFKTRKVEKVGELINVE